ncbi:hypothetical protein BRD56_01595 [Thermoplasmatales archaeon SW_10_69_26]|nr:MAG: hypothetical protein BRD56_01595 [Thermoplasmatales archaeon SW_10_69_26]
MPLRISNSLTGEEETFEPLAEDKVRLYVCGLTPYTDIHAGHARTYIAFDIVRRWLEHEGYDVIHVQNITDVEDKIIDYAEETGEDPLEVALREHAKAEALFDEARARPPLAQGLRPHPARHRHQPGHPGQRARLRGRGQPVLRRRQLRRLRQAVEHGPRGPPRGAPRRRGRRQGRPPRLRAVEEGQAR